MEHPTELYDLSKDVCLERVKLDEASGIEYKMIQRLLHARRTVQSKMTKSDSCHRWKMAYSKILLRRFMCRRWKMGYTKIILRRFMCRRWKMAYTKILLRSHQIHVSPLEDGVHEAP